jgi:putative transposase
MQVASRGNRAWRLRPISQQQGLNMVIWAHTLEQHHLSLQGHGQPCMIEKLQKLWLKVGYRRAVWLLRENGIKIIGAPKFRVMTDSNHAPSLLKHDFRLMRRTKMPLGDAGVICR